MRQAGEAVPVQVATAAVLAKEGVDKASRSSASPSPVGLVTPPSDAPEQPQPSRDTLVRGATPSGASGKVYGFGYSGLDAGSALTPLAFGWLMDRGAPGTVFVVAVTAMLLTILTAVQMRRSTPSLK